MTTLAQLRVIARDLWQIARELPAEAWTYRAELLMSVFLCLVGVFLSVVLAGFGE